MLRLLVWRQASNDDGLWLADCEFGTYRVWQASGTCWVHPPGHHRGCPGSPDIDTAKQVAQLHYAEALSVLAAYEAPASR